jgi:hypothetical protein
MAESKRRSYIRGTRGTPGLTWRAFQCIAVATPDGFLCYRLNRANDNVISQDERS